MVCSKKSPGPAYPAQDLVKHHVHPVPRADLADAADVVVRRDEAPGRQTTDRLQDEGQNVLRPELKDPLFDRPGAVGCVGFH